MSGVTGIPPDAAPGNGVRNADGSAHHVVIVDDQPANVRLLERVLQRAGYTRVTGITDAHEAIAVCRRNPPDILLIDLHMPRLDGVALMEKLRADVVRDTHVPIVVITGDESDDSRDRALQAGAVDFITKPFELSEVLLRVQNHLEVRSLHVRLEEKVRERTRQLESAHQDMLERLAQAAEFRDDATGKHTHRVGETSGVLARALDLGEEEATLIRRAAPLHDVGKIGIPDAILLKPGPLTTEERSVMRSHTTIGGRILRGGGSPLLRMAEQVALTHHERWDGAGYPRGLAGEEIPICGRIVALADFVDALSHDRPYRPAWPKEKIAQEVAAESGKHFDPRVADLVARIL